LKLHRLVSIAADDPRKRLSRQKPYALIEVNNGKEYSQRGVVEGTIGVDTIISTQV
jgi:hypothetical protein